MSHTRPDRGGQVAHADRGVWEWERQRDVELGSQDVAVRRCARILPRVRNHHCQRGPSPFALTEMMKADEQIPFTSIQFPLYEALKTQLSRRYLGGRRPSPGEAAGCGMIAGGFAAAVTTPLDVVKTRVMLEAKAS